MKYEENKVKLPKVFKQVLARGIERELIKSLVY